MLNVTDHNKLMKQVADYQMLWLNNSVNALTMLQSRNEKAMDLFMNQMNWTSEKWKDTVTDWSKAYQEGFTKFSKLMEKNLSEVRLSNE